MSGSGLQILQRESKRVHHNTREHFWLNPTTVSSLVSKLQAGWMHRGGDAHFAGDMLQDREGHDSPCLQVPAMESVIARLCHFNIPCYEGKSD